MKTMKQVAVMLKKAREKRQLSLRAAARVSGVSAANLSKLESGKLDNPTMVTIVLVSAAYGVKPEDWF